MKLSDFKTTLPGAPPLPASLPDDYPLEQYIIDLFAHAKRVEGETKKPLWSFSIDSNGTVRGDLKVPVTIEVQVVEGEP